jgi:putative ABC transport system permease protein
MTSLRVLLFRVLDLLRGRAREDRLAIEIQAHLEQLAEEYIGRGHTPAEARLLARRAFGGIEQIKEEHRDQRGLPWVGTLAQDARFATRILRRNPGFTATAVLVLGLGIGINNMLFTVLNAHTIRGLPIPDAERVLFMSTIDERNVSRGVSYPDYLEFRDAARTLEGLAAFSGAPVAVSDEGRTPERFEAAFVSGNTFSVLGVQPRIGRVITPADDQVSAPRVAIIGESVRRSRYASDSAIVGRSIRIDDTPAVIIGVMPRRSGFPSTAEIWLPLQHRRGATVSERESRTLTVFGRARTGISTEAAAAEVESLASRLAHDHPQTNRNVRFRVVPINEHFIGSLTHPAWRAFIAVACLMVLISCANVANLLLDRVVHRTREIAIRASLGARRGRIMRQLLAEAFVLAALGGTIGLAISIAAVRLFRSGIPENALPYWFDYSMDSRVLAALVAVSFATTLLFGLLPAIHASRADVNRVLKDGGLSGARVARVRRWTTALVGAQLALAVVLLAQVSVSLRGGQTAVASDRVLDSTDILTATVTLPPASYGTPEQRLDFYDRLEQRLRAVPGVTSISTASTLPLTGAPEERLDIAGRAGGAGDTAPTVRVVAVGPAYFETLGLGVLRGRPFSADDGQPGQRHVIVNERLAEKFFADVDALGQRIAIGSTTPAGDPKWLTIIGIAPAIRQRAILDAEPLVYVPIRTAPPATAALLVRSRNETKDMALQLRHAAAAIDPNLPLYRMSTMAAVMRDAQWNGRLSRTLIMALTFIAVGLTTVGLYAVTAHGVSQRTHEIGVRMALGAQRRQLVRLVLRGVFARVAMGFGAGFLSAIVWAWMFATGRPDIAVMHPESLMVIGTVLTTVALVASIVPVRRAIRLDPVAAIRHE